MKKMFVNSGSAVKDEAVVVGYITMLVLFVFGIVFVLSTNADATVGDVIGHWNNFQDHMVLGTPPTVQTLNMDYGDELMIEVSGVPVTITDAGYGDGYWYLGLLNSSGAVIGWANNTSPIPGDENWLFGEYSSVLGANNRPSDAVLVYDRALDGWDLIDNGEDGAIIGSAQDIAEGDMFFWTDDIFFDGTLGNIDAFDPYGVVGDYARIPEMTVVIPEPATLAILTLGGLLLRKRS